MTQTEDVRGDLASTDFTIHIPRQMGMGQNQEPRILYGFSTGVPGAQLVEIAYVASQNVKQEARCEA